MAGKRQLQEIGIMNKDSKRHAPAESQGIEPLPPWLECDVFCIQGYADTNAAHCGWRGRMREVQRDAIGRKLVCPRCGNVTLFRVPM